MVDVEFDNSPSIFKNREALSDDYIPKEIVGRDEELEKYRQYLQPVVYNEQPNNVFLYGKTGVGKTVSTKYILKKLKEATEDSEIELGINYINCNDKDTSYRVATDIVNQNRDPENEIPTRGFSTSEVVDYMWKDIDKLDSTTHLIVLDEVDKLKDDKLLYHISRAKSEGSLEDTKLGLIGISNSLSYKQDLSSETRSSLYEESITFSTYDALELEEVLRQRENIAFKENVVENEVIPLCSAYGAKKSGDAREAIKLLLKSGDIARNKGTDKVRTEHAEEAKRELERGEIIEGIKSLNEQEKFLVYAIVLLEKRNRTPVKSKTIYERYKSLTAKLDMDPLSVRWSHDRLDTLSMLDILEVEEKNEGRSGGRYRTYSLAEDPDTVMEALDKTDLELKTSDLGSF